MALSANAIIERKEQPQRLKLKVVDGLVQIYKGALLEYELSNIGYVQPATTDQARPAQPEFAGIALEEVSQAAADNTSDGTFEVLVIPRGSGEYVKLTTTATITVANEGDAVYMDHDGAVDLVGNVSNTTGGLVGIIRQFVSANKAWVQLVQSPVL